jgi:hypothetical protein
VTSAVEDFKNPTVSDVVRRNSARLQRENGQEPFDAMSRQIENQLALASGAISKWMS